jgi:hypothetical protein
MRADGSACLTALAHHFDAMADMLTAVAIQGFQLFVDHVHAAVVGIDRALEALHANGRAYLRFS